MPEKTRKKAFAIMILTLLCCSIMAIVETVIEPVYAIKSAIKALVFLLFPLIFAKMAGIQLSGRSFALDRKRIIQLLALGGAVYAIIMIAYALTKNIFDYSALVRSLSEDQKITEGSFLPIALYISFGNSFLEEFLFRYLSFLVLSKYIDRKIAYAFSAIVFAVYHIAMIGGAFPPVLLLLAVIGLAVGGYLFDYVDEEKETIYNSWIIHMFADFAIMTVWYLHL